MQSLHRPRRRSTQPLYRTLAGLTCLLGPCLWLILPLLVEAGSVSRIYGSAVFTPPVVTGLCQSPQLCPDFWDFRPTEGPGVIYGNRAYGSADPTCRKSTDAGFTFALCPTNYSVTNVAREVDIPANGSILSMRYEAVAANQCVIDKSVDGGASWTIVTIAAGVGFQCGVQDTSFNTAGEKLRCIGSVCLALVSRSASGGQIDIYRSADNGDTWGLVSSGVLPVNCFVASDIFFDGTNGAVTCVGTVTGEQSTRRSSDAGMTWLYTTPPANISTCGRAALLPGFDNGFSQICGNSTVTSLRILSTLALAKTPSSQPVFGSIITSVPTLLFLNTESIWIFVNTTSGPKVFRTTIDGEIIYEAAESALLQFASGRVSQSRVYQNQLMVSVSGNPRMILLQGN